MLTVLYLNVLCIMLKTRLAYPSLSKCSLPKSLWVVAELEGSDVAQLVARQCSQSRVRIPAPNMWGLVAESCYPATVRQGYGMFRALASITLHKNRVWSHICEISS